MLFHTSEEHLYTFKTARALVLIYKLGLGYGGNQFVMATFLFVFIINSKSEVEPSVHSELDSRFIKYIHSVKLGSRPA